ncbi:P-type conjugative transfer protein TrbL [Pelagibacterium lentulum]|uniref:Conjugal transfer protein TrbL n=1 Tax=Pelagibacterium lentulum TaxID=2029865 RepID=A0A916W457_9HYPH|nr:P-type conjugative transfer protein TrbL [Pelagibacterium lentulum]GGA64441.1 conjugal transfer protein TrbL [Pelagibacterium lentulum]
MCRYLPFSLVLAAALVLPDIAIAQDGSILDRLEDQIVSATGNWEQTVINAATSLFWILAGIEIAIAAVWLAIQSPSLDTWFGELVRRIMFIGFFLFVLQAGPDFAWAIVDSLFQLGAEGGKASPADTFNAGISVAAKLSENAKFGLWEDNLLGLASMIAMAIVVICFSLVAALFVSVLVEMYVGLLAGMIMLGLGGSSYTKDFAIRYLIYAFSVGMKLMGLVMIAKIGSDILIGLADEANFTGEEQIITALTIGGISVVIFMVALHVPTIIQGMVQGVSTSSGMETFRAGAQVASFAAAGAGAALGAGGVVKGGMAAASAAKASGAGAGGQAAAAMRAMGGSVGSAATDKLMGIPGAKMGSTLGLANQKLRDQRSGGNYTKKTMGTDE